MKKRKKKLPIGLSDFKDMIEKNYYYFDKSELIENIFLMLRIKKKIKNYLKDLIFPKVSILKNKENFL